MDKDKKDSGEGQFTSEGLAIELFPEFEEQLEESAKKTLSPEYLAMLERLKKIHAE
jgi:tetrahydromethanopterin S-methyltransferase subunit A